MLAVIWKYWWKWYDRFIAIVIKHDTMQIVNPKVLKTKSGKTMLWSKCARYDSKKSGFIKEQGWSKMLNQSEMKTPLSKTSLLVNILF